FSLMRFSWALLFIPYLILSFRPATWRQWIGTLFVGSACIVAVLAAVNLISSPGGNSVYTTFGQIFIDPLAAISGILEAMLNNFRWMLRTDQPAPNNFGYGQNVQIIALFAALSLATLFARNKKY